MTDDTAVAGRGCTIRTHDSQVPIYIFYATLCDVVEVSIQSRVPLGGLKKAFDAGMAHLAGEGVPPVAATPPTRAAAA